MDLTIAGSVVIPAFDRDQYGRINIELAAFDGEIGTGQFPVPDPTGSAFVASGRQLKVAQGSALLSDGFIIDQDWQRGPFRNITEREYNYSVQDANALLGGFRVVRTRPIETDYARVIAFAALDAPTWDTTWVLNTSTVSMPTKQYDGDDGWGELIADLVEFSGKTLFLHDKAAGGRCLHYHVVTTGHTCGLVITDVAGSLDATHFAPIQPLRQSTAIDLANDIRGRDDAGRTVYRSDPTSIATHNADGLLHRALIDFSATSLADLTAKTAAYLASNKDERHTYTCAIGPLDATALALIRVGDIMTVTSRAMGLSASDQRIAHMALSPWNGEPDLWQAQLELGAPVRRRARVRVSTRGTVGPTPGTFDAATGPTTNLVTSDIDDFTNRTITLAPVVGFSDAAVEGAWGVASGGGTWRSTAGGVAAYYGVNGGIGQWQVGGFPGNVGDTWEIQLIDNGVGEYWYPEVVCGEGSLFVRFRFNTVGTDPLAAIDNTELHLKNNGSVGSWSLLIMTTQRTTVADNYRGRIEFIGGDLFGKTDWIANEWYTLEVQQSGTTASARVWADSESTPSFQVTYTVASAFPWSHDTADGDSLDWEAVGENDVAAWTMDTDRIYFETTGTPVSGQIVVNDIPPETPNGILLTFSVFGGGPFRTGSLHVTVNGIDWTGQLASVNEFAGTYTFTHAPKTGDEIVASWMVP